MEWTCEPRDDHHPHPHERGYWLGSVRQRTGNRGHHEESGGVEMSIISSCLFICPNRKIKEEESTRPAYTLSSFIPSLTHNNYHLSFYIHTHLSISPTSSNRQGNRGWEQRKKNNNGVFTCKHPRVSGAKTSRIRNKTKKAK